MANLMPLETLEGLVYRQHSRITGDGGAIHELKTADLFPTMDGGALHDDPERSSAPSLSNGGESIGGARLLFHYQVKNGSS